MPEAPFHHQTTHRLTLLLEAWAARQDRPLRVLRNLALRWLEDYPTTGTDPDVCLLDPPPADLDDIGSICLWKPGHVPPPICFETVSRNHPYKDYCDVQDRYAAVGTHELVIFDPTLAGPRSLGGPVPLQLWRRDMSGGFERVHFGGGPAYSEVLDAWLLPEGRSLHIANDRRGTQRWLTEAEYAQGDAEGAKAAAERAKAAAERATAAAERAKADAGRAKADAERAKADAERERLRREELERQLEALQNKPGR